MFHLIGTWGGARCIYSRGSTDISTALLYLSELRKGPWIWFFDCADLNALDMQFVKRIATVLREEHATALIQVWILNCNVWMRGILRLFGQEKVQTTEGRIETVATLAAVRCPQLIVDGVIAAMSASPDTTPVRR